MVNSILNNPSTLVVYKNLRFLILDSPKADNLAEYIKEMQNFGVVMVVRACEPLYDKAQLKAKDIGLVELPFEDGGSPPEEIVLRWLEVLEQFQRDRASDGDTLAVHCVAGLGRAPLLVAIALIENGQNPLEAVDLIRTNRRGAINANQLQYLRAYKPTKKKKAGKCTLV